jgi:hypothetical protein
MRLVCAYCATIEESKRKMKVVRVINSAVGHGGMKESGGIALPFQVSALDGGEWPASRPGRLTPRAGFFLYGEDQSRT